jgi:2-dehydro-3-deoxygalactonokinase
MNQLPDTALSDYLSGLLIGAEVAEATKHIESPITIIANPALGHRYSDALKLLRHESSRAPDDCVAAGHWRIARSAALC